MMAAMICISVFIRIPLPLCPITLQVEVVIMTGLIGGAKIGAFSAVIYMLIGLLGMPVFSQGGGIAYVTLPTFGYIPGFVFGAYLAGRLKNRLGIYVAAYAALFAIYAVGAAYAMLICNIFQNVYSLKTLMIAAVALPLPIDCMIMPAAVKTADRIIKEIE